MDKRYLLRPKLLAPALALTISLAACGGGSPVTLKHITPGGPNNCYLPAFDGKLVSDHSYALLGVNSSDQTVVVGDPEGGQETLSFETFQSTNINQYIALPTYP